MALFSPETVLKETLVLKRKKPDLHNINAEKKNATKSKKKKERNRKSFTNKDGFGKADTK